MQFRQGDVFVESCRFPAQETLVEVVPESGRIVLAHGVATGHAHALPMEDAELYEHLKTKERFLRIVRETDILHEEHAPIRLQPGDYRVRRQREYSPGAIRNVQD